MLDEHRRNLGKIIKQQRLTMSLTLQELSARTSISPSHLGRIENGERFPSASILKKLALPLGFDEDELFTLAGYLSPRFPRIAEKGTTFRDRQLDPYVARVLGQEPVEVQKAVVGLLTILKSIASNIAAAENGHEKSRNGPPGQV